MSKDSDPPSLGDHPFDARLFEPPAWATTRQQTPPSPSHAARDTDADAREDDDQLDTNASERNKFTVEEDANGELRFTLDELKKLLLQATAFKEKGNAHFMAIPRRLDEATQSYRGALDCLPDVALPRQRTPCKNESGVQEITDEEAERIIAESSHEAPNERETVEEDIRQCTRAVWGNLGAVYSAKEEWKDAVDACTQALKIDKYYTKALQRRAIANEKLGSWSSLSAAQEDYRQLSQILAPSSPQMTDVKRALSSLPQRITVQQEKEKDEMVGKLKDLGNSILGKFGLSTDMFKFDEQPGGGYNLRFQS